MVQEDVTSNDSKANVISDKITFEDWLRVINDQDLVGVWEVEQLRRSRATSRKANIKCRLLDPEGEGRLPRLAEHGPDGRRAVDATSASNVLDYEEFKECIARCGCAKYSAVKVMKPAAKVRAMIQNMVGERDEVTVLREDTYIRAERFDWKNESKPLPGMGGRGAHAFLADWARSTTT